MERYARPDIPNRSLLLSLLADRSRQLMGLSKKVSIFSSDGLRRFLQTGYLTDLPADYVYPLQPRDRLVLLKRLAFAAKEGTMELHMVNPLLFQLPDNLILSYRRLNGIDFHGVNFENNEYRYLQLEETSLMEIFRDFILYLSDSPLVCTQEETLDFLDENIRQFPLS